MKRLETLPRESAAVALYAGRGASLGRRAATAVGAPLFVLSAGLGLVRSATPVPTYGITVAGRGEDSVASRVEGRFDPASWWTSVSAGSMSVSFDEAFGGAGGGIVLVALTAPYAHMVGPQLSRLPSACLDRMRIFGWRLRQTLPSILHPSVMDYDDRLEAALPGTRADFAQRALSHFAECIVPAGPRDRAGHGEEVESALSGLTAPNRVKRSRAPDVDILAWIARSSSDGAGVGHLLKRIRQDGVACEQARFTRLYRQALQSKEAE